MAGILFEELFALSKRKALFILIPTWMIAIIIHTLANNTVNIDTSLIIKESGTIIRANCVNTRSINSIEIQALFEKNKITNIPVPLESSKQCDDAILKSLKGKKIDVSSYKNYQLGVIANNTILISEWDRINQIENHSDSYFWLAIALFITILSILSLFLKR